MKEYAILLDSTNCTGCNSCGYRCIQEFQYHDLASRGHFRTFVQINDEGLYHRRCMHCLEPQCVKNCPVTALTKSAYGPVLYSIDTCIGCKNCVRTCPFQIPQYDATTNKVVKCSFCAHRVSEGKEPACVEACPTYALQFGEYNAIMAQAQDFAKKKKMNLYGLQENGGTHLFVLSKENPLAAGYPKVAKMAAKGKKVSLEGDLGVPAIAALAFTGLKKFSDRRSRVEAEAKKAKE
jgi:Fe-S-cluster-containing dehydrogenase component